jgi:hypothetical protein
MGILVLQFMAHARERIAYRFGALAKNPDDRFQTVEEFGVALEHPENVSAPPPPLPVRPSAAARGTVIESGTGAGKMIVAGVVIAAAAIVLAVFLWPGKKAEAPALRSSGGASSGSEAGPSIGEPATRPGGPASADIVAALGGSDTEITPPANAKPRNTTPSQKGVSDQPRRNQQRTQTAQNQPHPQHPPAYQSPQPSQPPSQGVLPLPQPHPHPAPSQAAAQSFIVKHRHIVMDGMQTQTYFCAGVLLVKSDGTVSYACAASNDPSRRCEQAVFPPGSIRQLKLRGAGELHLNTSSMGNWDFYDYNVAGSTSGAYQAILPFVR